MTEKIDFFRDELPIHRDTLNKITVVLEEAKTIFELYEEVGDWVYELTNNACLEDLRKGVKTRSDDAFSYSTNSMMLFAQYVVLGKIKKRCPLIADIKSDNLSDVGAKSIENNLQELIKRVKKRKTKGVITTSGTFGENDPFTLTWIYEILQNTITSDTSISQDIKDLQEKISKELLGRVKSSNDHHTFGKILIERDFTQLDHAFPILKCIHFLKTLKDNGVPNTELAGAVLPNIREYLLNKVYKHVSASAIENSSFDAAELVFAMEGVILIDRYFGNFSDTNLINQFFETVKESQTKSAYWRPLRPVITTKKGMALLPLSIEIASALLRICKLLEEEGSEEIFYFDHHIKLFEKYVGWLYARKVRIEIKDSPTHYSGWHSEHVHAPDKIHPWETVHVILFLMHYKTMYEEYLGRLCLKATNLIAVKLEKNNIENWSGEPLKSIKQDFITSSENFSMLLYGPPGTGKSSIGEGIAYDRGWKMISITPSDFISEGPAQVESRAKNIFEALKQQKNVVILLDEIDRLILDRDSRFYSKQEDIFQFMTPSMLIKFKDLRERKWAIFIVATNYEERIDNAIKRSGRIDEKYLICPPDFASRSEIIQFWLSKESVALKSEELQAMVIKTALATHKELKKYCQDVSKKLSAKLSGIDVIIKKLEQPSIRLSAYNGRFKIGDGKEFDGAQQPFKEFLKLVYLKCEGQKEVSIATVKEVFPKKPETTLIKKVFDLMDCEDDKRMQEEIAALDFSEAETRKLIEIWNALKD